MGLLDRAQALARLGRWGTALAFPNTAFPSPVTDNPKFLSAIEAVRLIADGSVVAASGLGGHQRASILYWAMVEEFAASGSPGELTVVNIGGHGGRGVLPGTLDELARPGLCERLISSHFETTHGFLKLAADGGCELQCLPLGVIALLFDAQARGRASIARTTGVGTLFDPRCGRGSPVEQGVGEQLIAAEGDQLRYRLPPVDVALFNLPAADRRGNLYARNAAIVGDSYEIAHAARRNGGTVIANVGLLVDEGYDDVFLPAEMVDAVVYYPETEQTLGYFHRDPWPLLTAAGEGTIDDGLAYARFGRKLAELTGRFPSRGPVQAAVVRLASTTLLSNVPEGATVVIGAGMPEDVATEIFEQGRLDEVTMMVESGAVGGLPAPGGYFGAAFRPREIVSTAEIFKRCDRRLDAACLGALEVDGDGNVNVSQRGPEIEQYSGPGGFTDFVDAADTLVFLCGWMRGGVIEADGGRIRIRSRGEGKFVERVREVSFNGQLGLRAGKKIYYATPVGLFRLTSRGVEVVGVFPGVDMHRDVDRVAEFEVKRPKSGEVQRLSSSLVSGEGFEL